ncbi:MAG: hemolysin family protein [Alphaproteobacteria bacterium]|nr:hemolysin family protein [Alphaproteobacteria bacterium]
MDAKVQEYVFDAIVILLLISINGILAMTELAIVSSNRTKMENLAKKSTRAKVALELINNPRTFLSTIQIGITIIGIVSGAYSGHKFAEPMGFWLNTFLWIKGYGNLVAFSLVVITIAYISIVFGELIPKCIAISKPEKMAIILAIPIRLLSKITYPFVFILDVSTKIILKFLNQKETKESTVTEEEIQSVMRQGLEEGAIDAFEHRVFQKILQFGDREASVIMTPRIKVAYLDIADSIEENTKKMLQNPHRYYPVFEGGLDNFKGILDTKDALTQQMQGKKLDLKALIKEAPCVIEHNLGPDLLDQFKKYKTHIAIVIDEYGIMQGIITLVDLFETLVGTIPELNQEKHYKITRREDGSWLCDGLTPIDEIEDSLAVKIVEVFEENDFNTLAGFLLIHLKHIPRIGEVIKWNNFQFEIIDMDGSRINKILIKNCEFLPKSE